MAKQLLGKEVTAALNEKIKANVAAVKRKRQSTRHWVLSVLVRNRK